MNSICIPYSDVMEVPSDEKPKKKPLPPKPWLKKKKNPSSTKTPPKPATGGYNLDFLDKLDDPNFDPFATKSNVVNDGEDQPLPKPSGYNLDFLDKMDDPNFDPFATKSNVVNDGEEKIVKIQQSPEKLQEKSMEIPEKPMENLHFDAPKSDPILDEQQHFEPKLDRIEEIQHLDEPEIPKTNQNLEQHFEFKIPSNSPTSKQNFIDAEQFDFDHFDENPSKSATPVDLPLLEILEPKKDSTPEFEKAEAEILEKNSMDKPTRVLSDKVKEELARNELIFQAQLLEKDKELHAKEKQVQMIDHEVHKLKMELKSLTDGNVEMM